MQHTSRCIAGHYTREPPRCCPLPANQAPPMWLIQGCLPPPTSCCWQRQKLWPNTAADTRKHTRKNPVEAGCTWQSGQAPSAAQPTISAAAAAAWEPEHSTRTRTHFWISSTARLWAHVVGPMPHASTSSRSTLFCCGAMWLGSCPSRLLLLSGAATGILCHTRRQRQLAPPAALQAVLCFADTAFCCLAPPRCRAPQRQPMPHHDPPSVHAIGAARMRPLADCPVLLSLPAPKGAMFRVGADRHAPTATSQNHLQLSINTAVHQDQHPGRAIPLTTGSSQQTQDSWACILAHLRLPCP